MNDQLQLFEPSMSELPILSAAHARRAEGLLRSALLLRDRGLLSVADAMVNLGRSALDDAFVCESAYQFERLAGLV